MRRESLVIYCSIAIVSSLTMTGCLPEDSQASSEPSEFEKKVADRTITLAAWTGASYAEKQHFAREYTRLHLGQFDAAKAQDIITYVDGSHRHLTTALRNKGLSQESIQDILDGTGLFLTCKAGARLMGWPTPVNSMEPIEDEVYTASAKAENQDNSD